MRVAIDAMGGDHAPGEIVRGAVAALTANPQLHVTLVGRKQPLLDLLNELQIPRERLSVVHAPEVIENDDDPGLAIRSKKQASMVVALQMVRAGQAEAALSAGNTGALMAGGVLFLGRLSGISRPALLTVMPSLGGNPVVLLDVGANMDARAEQLVQYARMGRIYAEKILNRLHPRVALLNVGTEENKGNAQVKKAHRLFREHVPGFIGNIEGTGFFFGQADVVVCDGFVGNVLLKIAEGLSMGLLNSMKEAFTSGLRYRLGALLLKPALQQLRAKMDASEYGGAPLVGIKGICIKCHGSSRSYAIRQALLHQVHPLVAKNVNTLFQETLLETIGLSGEMNKHAP